MRLDQKQLRKIELERRRGWILHLLYVAKPKPIDFKSLLKLLDARNMPMSCWQFAEKLDFLRSAGLLRVFPLGSDGALSEVEQAKLIQRYCESDGELDDDYSAKITNRGINFQEGQFEEDGVTRVN
ncbi:MAG TPA: hypothetical protein PKY59_12605 [Pyrinomonadaceae bacterium]|nr:hypothetical protein [Pyrinomonadaceae bacterium]